MDDPTKEVDKRVDVPPDTVSSAYEGDAIAQLMLGKAYLKAIFVENNDLIAFDWILRSAEQGNMEAQFRLGDLYALGQGTIKNLPDSYKWYTMAAIQGYKKALTRIHNLYQEDIKMYCRGQINSEEEEWASSKFKKDNYIRELNEYRLEQNKSILNGAVSYYTGQLENYRSSNQGDPAVQLNLAFLYQHGYGLYRYGLVRKNIILAFDYYTMAAEQGDIDAQYNLGNLYQKHTDIKFNYRQAFKWYKESAQGGNIAAQRSLAYFYLKGLATDIDYATALFWYTKAAESGDSESQVILGKLYRKGDCVKQDLSVAVKWYSQAARQGNTVARNCLSQLYQRDILDNIELDEDMLEYLTEDSMNSRLCTKLSLDVSKLDDSPRFKQLNELARRALVGDGHAMYEIGLKYFKGDNDFTQHQEIGIKWIKRAANAKHKGAQFLMADLYKKGDSIEQDYRKAAIWYKTLAKKKDAQAQCNVGIMYNEGLGVRKDPLEAGKWFIWATNQGNSDGQYYLGTLRLEGSGMRQDKEDAVKLFYESAKQKNLQACYEFGKIFFYGRYEIDKNTKRGLLLLNFSAKNNLLEAQLKLGTLYKETTEDVHDLPKSIQYFTMAADLGSLEAKHTLATIYLNGNNIDQDYIKAYIFFKQAISEGYSGGIDVFQTPMLISESTINCSKVMYMLTEITRSGIDNLHYNIGILYERGVKRDGEYIFSTNYASAMEWYLAASAEDDSRADYRLGIMHEYGKGLQENIGTAISYYNKASLKGNTDATYRLGCIYANGYGVAQDLLKAFHLFTNACSRGHEDANKELKIERDYSEIDYSEREFSRSLLNEDSKVPVNRKTRVHMLEKATEKGYIMLQYELGVAYEKGEEYQKAFEWFSLAADIGVTDACYKLGVFYEEGRYVKQDYVMAAKMYQKAAENEHEGAYYRIGNFYQYGKGVELDYFKAYQFYQKSDKIGHKEAHKVLNITLEAGTSFDQGTEEYYFPSSQEFYDSFSMCKYVATQGDAELQFKIGLACEQNYLIPDYKEAFKWYSMAANNSHIGAMYRLGFLYEKGLGVSRDHFKATQLYNRANQHKSSDALYRLAIAYHYGEGANPNFRKAIEYYKGAAELGHQECQVEFGRLHEEGELVPTNLLEAFKWYTKAYMQGYDAIRTKLHEMYQEKPYEIYFYQKLVKNLSVASVGHFRLIDSYNYIDYGDLNSELGALYVLGRGTKKNMMKAWEYLSKGYSDSADSIPDVLFFLRSKTLSSSEKAYILNVIEQDRIFRDRMNEQQLFALGMHFFDGVVYTRGVITTIDECGYDDPTQSIVLQKDPARAFECLKNVADKNYPPAIVQLGIMYHCGYGIEQDIEKGEKCFNMILDINLDYVGSIAMLYHTHEGLQNFEKALEWYKLLEERLSEDLKDSDRKRINGQLQAGLGLLYEYGDGVGQDYHRALECYKNLADESIKMGSYRLGLMYYYGKGTSIDYQTAFDLFGKAIEEALSWNGELPSVYADTDPLIGDFQNNLVYRLINDDQVIGESYYWLGLMFKNGKGTTQNEDNAQIHFRRALYYGCERAIQEVVIH